MDLSAKLGRRITLEEFGELVGKAEKGRGRAYSKGAISEWVQDRNEPTLAAFLAIVAVTAEHTPPGRSKNWLIFGEQAEDEEAPSLRKTPIRRVSTAAEKRKRKGA